MPKIVVIDNYDSFVYILVQYLGELGADISVVRNDSVNTSDIADMNPDGLLVSPGPGTPADAGISLEAIEHFGQQIPVFGVCLGHQCIGELYGGDVIRAPELMHGKTSEVHHQQDGVFAGIKNPMIATRYHSLIVDAKTLPNELTVTASTQSGLIMGLRHKTLDVEGVQFHPESVLTTQGHQLVKNFITRCS